MKEDLLKILADIGFSEKEAKVYLALLALEAATANEIAKKADINRTSAYDVLEILIKRGVVSKYKKKSRTFFNVSDPRKLIAYLEHEKADHEKTIEKQKTAVSVILPELISLQMPLSTRPKVQFYEGEKGMREAYEDTLNAKEGILAYANVETVHAGIPNFFPEYYQRRTKLGVPIKAIFTENELSRERASHNREELRQTKFLPDASMKFSPEVNIYNNKVLIASWQEKMAVIIESKEYADLMRLTYQLLWDRL
ncbi:MAG: helix-turn-helix domain-containing protein [Patescibacteria group bacterium]